MGQETKKWKSITDTKVWVGVVIRRSTRLMTWRGHWDWEGLLESFIRSHRRGISRIYILREVLYEYLQWCQARK